MSLQSAVKYIEPFEARKLHLYFDEKNILTGGVGIAFGHVGVSDDVRKAMEAPGVMDTHWPPEIVDLWLTLKVSDAWKDVHVLAQHAGVDFDGLSENRQNALTSMCYQLGAKHLAGFQKMWAAMGQGDWGAVEREALDSTWAREDSPARAKAEAALLRTG